MKNEPAFQSFLASLNSQVSPSYSINIDIKEGAKYARIERTLIANQGRSCYGFLVLENNTTKTLGTVKRGDLLKGAGWAAPAKNVRGNLFNKDNGMDCCDGVFGVR